MNRSKAPLLLMEQLVMLLVFALAAALCVRAFVLADTRSRDNDARSQALLAAQTAAEEIKAAQRQTVESGGTPAQPASDAESLFPEGQKARYYQKDWSRAEESSWSYCLEAKRIPSENPLLGRAEVCVTDREGNCLVKLPLAWQTEEGQVAEHG